MELIIGNSKVMTNMTTDERDAGSDARGEGDLTGWGMPDSCQALVS